MYSHRSHYLVFDYWDIIEGVIVVTIISLGYTDINSVAMLVLSEANLLF